MNQVVYETIKSRIENEGLSIRAACSHNEALRKQYERFKKKLEDRQQQIIPQDTPKHHQKIPPQKKEITEPQQKNDSAAELVKLLSKDKKDFSNVDFNDQDAVAKEVWIASAKAAMQPEKNAACAGMAKEFLKAYFPEFRSDSGATMTAKEYKDMISSIVSPLEEKNCDSSNPESEEARDKARSELLEASRTQNKA